MTDHSRNEPSNKETKTLDYQAGDLRPGKRASWARRLAAPFIVICLIVIVWRFTRLANRLLPLAYKAAGVRMPTRLQSSPPEDVTEFYNTEISPLLDAALQRNRRAADRAILSLHDRFNAHRAGVKAFAQDVSGWATRFGVMQSFATDVWDKHVRGNPSANGVGDYIQEKFRMHVLSEQSLQADVEDVLKQYRQDLEASRNQLFAEIKLPLHGRNSPIVLDEKGWEALCVDIDQRARQLNATTPRDSVVTGLVALAGGWIGTEAVEAVVAQVLARVGTTIAVEAAETAAATGGSALAGGTATGGGIGSLGGPAGTVIGVGVGLAVGVAIDWWLSDRLEDHVSEQCNRFLDTVEHNIVEGNGQTPGLRASFEQALKLADERQRKAVIDALTEAGK